MQLEMSGTPALPGGFFPAVIWGWAERRERKSSEEQGSCGRHSGQA